MVVSAGPSSSSAQGQTVSIPANQPTQIPLSGDGVTVINEGGTAVTLGTDAYLAQSTVNLPAGASLPWKFSAGGVLYAYSPVATTIVVMQGLFNYYNPNVLAASTAPTSLFTQKLTFPTTSLNAYVAIPNNVRTLVLQGLYAPGTTFNPLLVQVIGQTTGLFYYNQHPYLIANIGNGGFLVVVPFSSTIDNEVEITLSFITAGAVTLNVYGDTAEYTESIYYNGQTQQSETSQNAIGTYTLVTGPARLLRGDFAPGSNNAQVNLIPAATAGPATKLFPGDFTFPPNTIILTGGSLQMQNITAPGFATLCCTWAYP